MCGIAGAFGKSWNSEQLDKMISIQHHRGPDNEGSYQDPTAIAGLGHNRLSIIDLSRAGQQPMRSNSGNYYIVFNGEIYNFLELKCALESEYEFRTQTDTEVLLAAYQKWGPDCLDRLIGMFSFVIWDKAKKTAFIARDRFGVKPLYYHQKNDGTLLIASEIKALHAAGVRKEFDEKIWATYLTHGIYNHTERTFWKGICSLPAGHQMVWKNHRTEISRWYDIAERIGDEFDQRPEAVVEDEYFELMKESVKLRFRSDVPVGINLSGGLDSSSLLGLVHAVQGFNSKVKAFTFITGDPDYDELPWVGQMLAKTNHSLIISKLSPKDVPRLAADVQYYQDEPFGGLPTLAYAGIFEKARENGVIVLLDGNGMDEQWAGYDYYQSALNGNSANVIQGTKEKPVRPECLTGEFRSLAEKPEFPEVFPDKIRNLQYRDINFTKITRAMRFNDRISMRSSTELREPFLDHRMFELALRQPVERKISNNVRKKMLRRIAQRMIPQRLSESPKRPVQTPQREWLRGDLREWADEHIKQAGSYFSGSWFDKKSIIEVWRKFCDGQSDNSFYIWQWISLSLILDVANSKARVKKSGE
ncbi:MAG: asparagine synthase (glutamine-hydrolyzing) [Pyrinomonadaceae bacterium]